MYYYNGTDYSASSLNPQETICISEFKLPPINKNIEDTSFFPKLNLNTKIGTLFTGLLVDQHIVMQPLKYLGHSRKLLPDELDRQTLDEMIKENGPIFIFEDYLGKKIYVFNDFICLLKTVLEIKSKLTTQKKSFFKLKNYFKIITNSAPKQSFLYFIFSLFLYSPCSLLTVPCFLISDF